MVRKMRRFAACKGLNKAGGLGRAAANHVCASPAVKTRLTVRRRSAGSAAGNELVEANGADFLIGRRPRGTRRRLPDSRLGPRKLVDALLVGSASMARAAVVAGLVVLAACATPPEDDPIALAEYEANNDPFEPLNREIFDINLFFDRILLKPAAQAYVWLFPVEFRDAVHNILTNADEPVNFANAVLQGDAGRAATAFGRLAINTTLGVGGMIDVASDLGLEPIEEDFGQTLAVWGLDSGPYLVLPLFGPATVRDGFGRVGDFFFDPLTYVLWNTDKEYIGPSILATTALDLRSRNLDTLDEIERTSVDFYATIRSLYQQRREDLINNGVTPDDEDPFISDPFDY